MNRINEIQTEIDSYLQNGYILRKISFGKSIGIVCDHCEKTGIDLVAVLALSKDALEYENKNGKLDDPMAYCVLLFGKGCLKHFKLEKKTKE